MTFEIGDLKKLYLPPKDSYKGQNGRLMIIGGSKLFHAASLWSLKVASRIVDLVHYASTPENNQLVLDLKKEFRDGIVVSRYDIENYIKEDDCILIGPGMTRDNETKDLTNKLLTKFPHKQWVIDAGALQMMDVNLIPKNAILTPHQGELQLLIAKSNIKDQISKIQIKNQKNELVRILAEKYKCILLVKGEVDIICDGQIGKLQEIYGGNGGMTKGGTGDVLAGLVAALACKNDPYLAACVGSFINKAAGDNLFKSVGPFFNASDLADEIPKTLKEVVGI